MRTKLHSKQDGFVSIIVTMIIIIVLSLIVIGFAQVARREQRNALDRQLSQQAFYAAESGINDAVDAVFHNRFTGNKTDCADDTADFGDPNLSTNPEIKYTCLLINQSPDTLQFNPVDTTKSTIFPIHASGSIDKLVINWSPASPIAGPPFFVAGNSHDFPPATGWNAQTGVLRVALTSLQPPLTRQSLIDNTFTAFLYPNTAAPSPPNIDNFQGGAGARANQGPIINGNCKPATNCTVNITLGAFTGQEFYLRLKSIYKPSSVTITALDASGNKLTMRGTQAMIDSTGKANDVLRRIQVRVPLTNTYDYPEYVLDSADSICKLLQTAPGSTTLDPRAAGDTACDPTQ